MKSMTVKQQNNKTTKIICNNIINGRTISRYGRKQ